MSTRFARAVVASSLCLAVGCSDAGPAMPPEGIWNTAAVPSGGRTSMVLTVAGSRVTGSAGKYGMMSVLESHFEVSGTWSGSSFTLTLTPTSGSGSLATFKGTVVSLNEHYGTELHGTWVEGGQSSQPVFYRLPPQ